MYNVLKNSSILSPVREHRDPTIWQGEKLLPDVREALIGKVQEFMEDFSTPDADGLSYIKRMVLIGSITGLQYEDDADLDVNALVNVDLLAQDLGIDQDSLITALRKRVFHVNGDLYPGTSHPINLYAATDNMMPPADGIYDLIADEWIKKPGDPLPPDWDPYNNLSDALKRAEEVAEKIDMKWGAIRRAYHELQKYPHSQNIHQKRIMRSLKSLKRILENIANERRDIMEIAKLNGQDPPQMSTPNVVYKALEHWGLLDILHKAQKTLKIFENTGELPDIA